MDDHAESTTKDICHQNHGEHQRRTIIRMCGLLNAKPYWTYVKEKWMLKYDRSETSLWNRNIFSYIFPYTYALSLEGNTNGTSQGIYNQNHGEHPGRTVSWKYDWLNFGVFSKSYISVYHSLPVNATAHLVLGNMKRVIIVNGHIHELILSTI